MPRFRRDIRPGCMVHIIVRFVNHEYLLRSDDERAEYLRRARIAFRKSDWRAISYALLDTHTHFGAIAGHFPFADISRPLHSGFVGWLNPRRGRLGSAIANRPGTHEIALHDAARLIAYHHNNPVRAGLVATAAHSAWTSHHIYLGTDSSDWIDEELGLQLAGFEVSSSGRRAFAELVYRSAHDLWAIRDDEVRRVRRTARRALGKVVELGQPHHGDLVTFPLWAPKGATLRLRWEGSLERPAALVAKRYRLDKTLLKTSVRDRTIADARRLLVVLCRCYLGRTLTEIAAFLSISVQAASKLQRTATKRHYRAARLLAEELQPANTTRLSG